MKLSKLSSEKQQTSVDAVGDAVVVVLGVLDYVFDVVVAFAFSCWSYLELIISRTVFPIIISCRPQNKRTST